MKVLLAAIAKNEAAYIPEWVFHHLKFGFDGVWIYVNKTSDNSHSIIEKISKKYPVVSFSADYLYESDVEESPRVSIAPAFKERNPFQSKAFVDIFHKAKELGFTHIAYFDLDEYVFSSDYSSVKEMISSSDGDIVKLRWFYDSGEQNCFSRPIKRSLEGEFSLQSKMIISTDVDTKGLSFVSTHHVKTRLSTSTHLFGAGKIDTNIPHLDVQGMDRNNFLLHRVYRSKEEYIAKLYNGDNMRNSIGGFKINRKGWHSDAFDSINVNEAELVRFNEGFEEFVDLCDLKQDLEHAQLKVIENSKVASNVYLSYVQDLAKVSRAFRGTGLPRVSVKR